MPNRIEGERVFCYQCENEWDRAHGGLQCPRCESEFVEIIPPGGRPDVEDPPEVVPDSVDMEPPLHPLRGHNPWGPPDPDEGDIRTTHFNTGGGGRGGLHFASSYTTSFGSPRAGTSGQTNVNMPGMAMGNDPVAEEVMRNFGSMVSGILGGGPSRNSGFHGTVNINGRTTHFGSGTLHHNHNDNFPSPPDEYISPFFVGARDANLDDSLFSLMFPQYPQTRNRGAPPLGGNIVSQMGGPFGALFSLMNSARNPDAAQSQEDFDRIMSQLMEQNQQNGAPPAPQELIDRLPKKGVDKSMLGNDDKAECSICMDNVGLGTEVTVLPCKHWFHFECIESWLKEHDTCPHCRKPITPADDQRGQTRSSARRRSSSVASPLVQPEGSRQNPVPDSPSGLRAAREQYYGRRVEPERERPVSERRPSRRSTSSRDDGGGGNVGTGMSGWIRSHMPF